MSKIVLIGLFICVIQLSLCEDNAQDDGWPGMGGFLASPKAEDSLENEDLLAVESQQYETKAQYANNDGGYQNERMAPKYRRRKHRYRPVLRYGGSYPSYDYKYDNEYIDRIDRDGVPASSGYGAPSNGYGPSSAVDYDIQGVAYEPQSSGYDAPAPSGYESQSYGAPSYAENSADGTIQSATYDDSPSYSGNTDSKKSTFSSFLNALAAFLPIGLFLAAIPPNLIVINSDETKRKRSAGAETDSIQQNIINKLGLGLSRLQETECQKLIACEMAVYGKHKEDANRFQRALSSLAYYTPEYVASYFNTLDVLQAIQNDDCRSFSCHQF